MNHPNEIIMKKLTPFKIDELYKQGFNGKKVLIIGHQKKNDNDPDNGKVDVDECLKCRHCENVVGICYADGDNVSLMKSLIDHEPWIDTHDGDSYRRFARMFMRNDSLSTDSDEWKNFWSRIAFFNYIQRHAVKPTGYDEPQEYEKMLVICLEHIEDLQPDVAICWGNKVYKRIEGVAQRKQQNTCVLKLKSGKEVIVLHLHHPSQGFSYPEHRKLLEEIGL